MENVEEVGALAVDDVNERGVIARVWELDSAVWVDPEENVFVDEGVDETDVVFEEIVRSVLDCVVNVFVV